MKMASRIAAVSIAAMMCSSCGPMTPDEHFVRQKIPIEIQSGNPATIGIRSLSGNGWNEVGLRCSPEVWDALTNGSENISVRLKSSNKHGTEIYGVSPGHENLWHLESFHYLFLIGGEYRAKAVVEISFKNAPPRVTHAEILVIKTPADTGS
jgi:hypothetical protein